MGTEEGDAAPAGAGGRALGGDGAADVHAARVTARVSPAI